MGKTDVTHRNTIYACPSSLLPAFHSTPSYMVSHRGAFRKSSLEAEMDEIGSDLCGISQEWRDVTVAAYLLETPPLQRGGLVPGDGTFQGNSLQPALVPLRDFGGNHRPLRPPLACPAPEFHHLGLCSCPDDTLTLSSSYHPTIGLYRNS